jgi:hypothetical protein
MSIKAKLNAAVKKGNSIAKEKDLPEVSADPRVFKGLGSKIKAKQTVKNDKRQNSFSVKTKGKYRKTTEFRKLDNGKIIKNVSKKDYRGMIQDKLNEINN